MRSPASSPKRLAWGTGSGATSVVDTPRIAKDAAASQPMNPAPMTTAESAFAAALSQRLCVGQ